VLLALWLKSHAGWNPRPPTVNVNLGNNQAGPLIDGHVSDIALEHSRLLDGPNPDDIIDIEIVE
jgi:hypothetical protein